MTGWKDRIIGEGNESPEQILANPMNWRKHPKYQKDALRGALNEIGWVQRVIVNQRTGHLVDGHLRVELALDECASTIPVIYVDLSEDEEKVALATLDSISALAETDQDLINEIVEQVSVGDTDLAAFLETLTIDPNEEEETDGETDDDDAPGARAACVSQPGDVWILGAYFECQACGKEYSYDDGRTILECPCDL